MSLNNALYKYSALCQLALLLFCFAESPAIAETDCEQAAILIIEKSTTPVKSGHVGAKSDDSLKKKADSRQVSYNSWLQSAEVDLARNQNTLALQSFKQVLELAKTTQEKISALNSIGNCEFDMFGTTTAIEAYDQAIKLLKGESGRNVDKRWQLVLRVNKAAALIEGDRVHEARELLSDIPEPELKNVSPRNKSITASNLTNDYLIRRNNDLETAEILNMRRVSNPELPMPSSRSNANVMALETLGGKPGGLAVGSHQNSLTWKSDPRLIIIHWTDRKVLKAVVSEFLEKDNDDDLVYVLQYHARDMRVLYGPESRQAKLASNAEAAMVSYRQPSPRKPDVAHRAELKARLCELLSELESCSD